MPGLTPESKRKREGSPRPGNHDAWCREGVRGGGRGGGARGGGERREGRGPRGARQVCLGGSGVRQRGVRGLDAAGGVREQFTRWAHNLGRLTSGGGGWLPKKW